MVKHIISCLRKRTAESEFESETGMGWGTLVVSSYQIDSYMPNNAELVAQCWAHIIILWGDPK
jgi:hypothetical protein